MDNYDARLTVPRAAAVHGCGRLKMRTRRGTVAQSETVIQNTWGDFKYFSGEIFFFCAFLSGVDGFWTLEAEGRLGPGPKPRAGHRAQSHRRRGMMVSDCRAPAPAVASDGEALGQRPPRRRLFCSVSSSGRTNPNGRVSKFQDLFW